MSPVSWHHLWVWIIPITIYVASVAYRSRSRLLWVCAAVPPIVIALRVDELFIPDPSHIDSLSLYGIQLITSNVVTYTSILLLIGLLAYVTFGKQSR